MVGGFGDAVIKQDAWDPDKARALPEISPNLPSTDREMTLYVARGNGNPLQWRQSEHWQKAKSQKRQSVLRDLSASLADRASRETF
jgi:hypothetical protein